MDLDLLEKNNWEAKPALRGSTLSLLEGFSTPCLRIFTFCWFPLVGFSTRCERELDYN